MKKPLLALFLCCLGCQMYSCDSFFYADFYSDNGILYCDNESTPEMFGNGIDENILYVWDFGDGTLDTTYYTSSYAIHQYEAEGVYEVCLTQYYYVWGEFTCSDSYCTEVEVDISAFGCDEGEYPIDFSVVTCCAEEINDWVSYTIYQGDDMTSENMVLADFINIVDGPIFFGNEHCMAEGCYLVQMTYEAGGFGTEDYVSSVGFLSPFISEYEVLETMYGLPWVISFCIEPEQSLCPFVIQSSQTVCDEVDFLLYGAPGEDNIEWSFGDGSEYTGTQYANHTYLEDGTYEVCAYVTTDMCPEGFDACGLVDIVCDTADCQIDVDILDQWCEHIVLHANPNVAADVQWLLDGVPYSMGYTATVVADAGPHQICALYTSENCEGEALWCELFEFENCGDGDCPEDIWSGEGEDCGVMNFQIITFVEGGDVVWYPGDGSGAVEGDNVFSHTYEEAGNYNVCAFYTSPFCEEGVELCIEIEVEGCGEGDCPDEIWSGEGEGCGVMHFEIGSFVEGEDVVWYPGDESGAVEGGHFFSHTYEEGGTYTVCAFYTSPACPDGVELCSEIEVESCGGGDCPDEIWSGEGEGCGVMHFEIGSFVEGEDVVWFPGDGTGPVEGGHFFSHEYAQGGTYQVCAFYTSPACPNGVELCTMVEVEDCNEDECPWLIYVNDTENCHLWHFEIGSFVEGESVTWYFNGDEEGIVGGHFIAHEFEENGIYTVCALYTSPNCPGGANLCTEVEVDCLQEECDIQLSAEQTGENSFTFTAIGNPVVLPMHWDFGDATTLEATWVTDHEYDSPGVYIVCAYVETEGCGVVEDCIEVVVEPTIGCGLEASIVQQTCGLLVLEAVTFEEEVEIHWMLNGDAFNVGNITTFALEAGQYEICLWYENEECGETIWCGTYIIEGCGECTEVNFGIDSYVGNGGTAQLTYMVLNESNLLVESGVAQYSAEDAFHDFNLCLEDGCYTLMVDNNESIELGLGVKVFINAEGENLMENAIVISQDEVSFAIQFGVNSECVSEECQAFFEPIMTNTPGHVEFQNLSTGTNEDTDYYWTYGDGQTSDDFGGNVWYEENGMYEVCLTISGENCQDTYCETIFVTNISCSENTIEFAITGEYNGEKLSDIVTVLFELDNIQYGNFGTTLFDGLEGIFGICVPDGCYDLSLLSDLPIVAESVEVSVSVNGLEVDVLELLEGGQLAEVAIGVNADCEDGVHDMDTGTWVVYPNPASSMVQVTNSTGEKILQIQVMDATGRTVLSTGPSSGPLDLGSLASGTYMIRLTGEKNISVQSIVIQK